MFPRVRPYRRAGYGCRVTELGAMTRNAAAAAAVLSFVGETGLTDKLERVCEAFGEGGEVSGRKGQTATSWLPDTKLKPVPQANVDRVVVLVAAQ